MSLKPAVPLFVVFFFLSTAGCGADNAAAEKSRGAKGETHAAIEQDIVSEINLALAEMGVRNGLLTTSDTRVVGLLRLRLELILDRVEKLLHAGALHERQDDILPQSNNAFLIEEIESESGTAAHRYVVIFVTSNRELADVLFDTLSLPKECMHIGRPLPGGTPRDGRGCILAEYKTEEMQMLLKDYASKAVKGVPGGSGPLGSIRTDRTSVFFIESNRIPLFSCKSSAYFSSVRFELTCSHDQEMASTEYVADVVYKCWARSSNGTKIEYIGDIKFPFVSQAQIREANGDKVSFAAHKTCHALNLTFIPSGNIASKNGRFENVESWATWHGNMLRSEFRSKFSRESQWAREFSEGSGGEP